MLIRPIPAPDRVYPSGAFQIRQCALVVTLPRGRPPQGWAIRSRTVHVVDDHYVIHALRRKPNALLNLVYRDQLFPRDAYRRTWDWLGREIAASHADVIYFRHSTFEAGQAFYRNVNRRLRTYGRQPEELKSCPALNSPSAIRQRRRKHALRRSG